MEWIEVLNNNSLEVGLDLSSEPLLPQFLSRANSPGNRVWIQALWTVDVAWLLLHLVLLGKVCIHAILVDDALLVVPESAGLGWALQKDGAWALILHASAVTKELLGMCKYVSLLDEGMV